jgi:glutathione S-transferase
LYLIDQYDKEGKLSYSDALRKYASVQWLMFQVSGKHYQPVDIPVRCAHSYSGQGPYFGQATWFARFHPEKLPSAIDRYVNEIDRVLGVLDDALSRNKTGWLVGDRCTYADISFVTWAATGEGLLRGLQKDAGLVEKYPHYSAWFATLKERPAIARALQEIAAQRKAHGLP